LEAVLARAGGGERRKERPTRAFELTGSLLHPERRPARAFVVLQRGANRLLESKRLLGSGAMGKEHAGEQDCGHDVETHRARNARLEKARSQRSCDQVAWAHDRRRSPADDEKGAVPVGRWRRSPEVGVKARP